MLSVVIPTQNEAAIIGARIDEIEAANVADEVIIADGGSVDGTQAIVERRGARLVEGPSGRGAQLAAGARAATGNWILFLHADTQPGPGWTAVIQRFMAEPNNRFRAGYFRFAVDDTNPAARRLEQMVNWRCQMANLPYGDQGLLINIEYYERLGGFPAIPLFEDVAVIRKIPRHRLQELPCVAVTSSMRFRRDGYLIRPLKNVSLLALYFLGVPPGYLATLYN